MLDKTDYIIGIDFGTTNSCAAMFINNKLEVIPDKSTGKRTIPSVVCYMKNNQVLVGKAAEEKQIEYSQSTIFQSKRYIGHKFKDPEVQYDIINKRMYVTITEDEKTKKAMYKIGDKNNKKFLYPEDVASEIIKYIKENAEKHLNISIQNAVVTVPTHFTNFRVNTVKEAFKKANLNVVKVIKEPEAIGIAYGYLYKKEDLRTILTIDIGGGTFGMSILQIQGDKYEIIGSEGSGHLGGDDFEKALRDYIVQQIEKENKFKLDFTKEKKHKDKKWVEVLSKIKAETSRVISELSNKEKVKFDIKKLDGQNDFTINISQDQYKQLTQPLLDKCERKLKDLFTNLQMEPNEIDEIILVGGTTKAPNIQKILDKFSNKTNNSIKSKIIQTLNADEAVAQGAAISAMKIQNDYIIGIDLGTTNSCSTMFINNKLEVIPDQSTGKRTIPSVVCYMENNEVLVGKLALQKQIEYSKSTIFQSKRYIGHKFKDPEVQYDIINKRMYVTITEDEKTKKAMYKIGDKNNKKFLYPEDVASEIIKYIKENAEKHLKNILNKEIILTKAVVTVPTHFTNFRVNTVKEAFKKANLNVVKVIKEPEAIGIAYGHIHIKKEQTNILTIDIGGGTFGMAILKIKGAKHEIIGSIGSGHLGGDDFEKSLRDYIVQQIEKENKFKLDFTKEKKHKDEKWVRVLLKIKEETSRVISELSKQKNVNFKIAQLDGKNDFTINISQDQYKQLTQPLLDKCEKKLKDLFDQSKTKINYKDINEIILVGGTTRAPNIKEILNKYFDKKTIFQTLNADEAVAQGAAISAM